MPADDPNERLTKMVDSAKLSEMFGITDQTINALRESGRIKGYKLIRQYRYDPEEVKAALAQETENASRRQKRAHERTIRDAVE